MGLGFSDGFKPQSFWYHYCIAQKDTMFFERGTECDWCGITEGRVKNTDRAPEHDISLMDSE